MKLLRKLKPFDPKSGNLNVVIDTPKGSRNKYAFDFKINAYKLKTVLPQGTVFPFDFGSIPGTVAEDGDPLDVLILIDEPVFIGCLVETRLLGVIEAEQSEGGKTERNDRLIAVAAESHTNGDLKSLQKLNSKLIGEIEHFFVSYNDVRGKKFKPTDARDQLWRNAWSEIKRRSESKGIDLQYVPRKFSFIRSKNGRKKASTAALPGGHLCHAKFLRILDLADLREQPCAQLKSELRLS
jgi:inorganic pyrophosphatase